MVETVQPFKIDARSPDEARFLVLSGHGEKYEDSVEYSRETRGAKVDVFVDAQPISPCFGNEKIYAVNFPNREDHE
jgi:hypothetical protein